MEITRIIIHACEYEDYVTLVTDLPGAFPTRRTNIPPFDTKKGNTLRLRFTVSGNKGRAYCQKHFPGIKIEELE